MNDIILEDKLYLLCMIEACKSRSRTERYGSLLIKDEEIIGRGYNHRYSGDEVVKMPGWGNHAEVDALDNALRNGFDPVGASVYVAGYFPRDGSLHIRDSLNFSCPKCPKYLRGYGVVGFFVPLIHGWAFLSIDESLDFAKEFKTNRHEKVLRIGKSVYNLDSVISSIYKLVFS